MRFWDNGQRGHERDVRWQRKNDCSDPDAETLTCAAPGVAYGLSKTAGHPDTMSGIVVELVGSCRGLETVQFEIGGHS